MVIISHNYAAIFKITLAFFVGVAGLATNSHAQQQLDHILDLKNPAFLREFRGSFEVDLYAGAPALDTKERVIISVTYDKYKEDIDQALDFIKEQARGMKSGYSANIEYTIGQLYQFKGNMFMAEKYFYQAIKKYPSYVAAYTRLMEIYLNQENCEKAVITGKKAVELGGANGEIFKGFGLCYIMAEKYSAALNAFRIANAFIPDDKGNRYYQAFSALEMGYTGEAISLLDELIVDSPSNFTFYSLLINALLVKEDNDRVIEIIEIARRRGLGNAATFNLLGTLYIKKTMPEAASVMYIKALEESDFPPFDKIVENFDNLSNFDDWNIVERYYNKIYDVYTGRLKGPDQRLLKVMKAQLLIGLEKTTDGVNLLKDVLSTDPTNGQALFSLASYYWQQKDYERADLYFERAAKEQDVAFKSLTENARMSVEQKKWLHAINLLMKANDIAPTVVVQRNIRSLEKLLSAAE